MKEALQRAVRARLSGSRARAFFARLALLLFACALAPFAQAQESVCAEVKIEIKQTVTLERQAFDAKLKIRNGLSLPVEAIDVSLRFTDADGVAVPATINPDDTSAKFFFRTDGTTDITGELTGTGAVAPLTTGEAHWLIVPTATAGGQTPDGIAYRVGATITYRIGAETKSVEVTPDTITVKPQPKLRLDYFLTHDVYGDDPNTPATEPVVPFTLGVRVWNHGYGRANAVAIESGQPKIVANDQGLLVDFRILEGYVGDAPAQPSLALGFGTIEAGAAKMGRWNMTASLSGTFDGFKATLRHADEFGGALTALIDPADIVEHDHLVRDVLADAPGRDSVRDFLVYDGDVPKLFESDGGLVAGSAGATLVTEVSGTLAGGGNTRQLTVAAVPNGFVYSKITDPFNGQLDTISAHRIEGGKTIPAANVWFSKERNAAGTGWRYYLNLFDFHDASLANQATYRLDAEMAPVQSASLSGMVYDDADGDGVRDAEDPAMFDVELVLSGNDAFGAALTRTTRSNALGAFAFTQLPAGTYRIDVGAAPGYRDGAHTVGTAGGSANAHGIDGIALASDAAASGYAFAKTRGDEAPDGADFVLIGIDVWRSGLITAGGGFSAIAYVRNDGLATASAAVHLSLPADFNVLNAAPTSGEYDAATKIWRIGPTPSGGAHQLVLTLVATQTGARTLGANVVVDAPAVDPRPDNNARTVDLTVRSRVPLSVSAGEFVDALPHVLVYAPCTTPASGGSGEKHGGEAKAECSEDRTAGFYAMLGQAGVSAYVATNDANFLFQLRSGYWNLVWVSAGTASSLSTETVRELAQAQLRDEWMIVDQPRGSQVFGNEMAQRLEAYMPAQYTSDEGMDWNTRTVAIPASRWLPSGTLQVHGAFAPYRSLGTDSETLGSLSVQDGPPAIQRINRTLLFGFDLYAALADDAVYRAAFLQQLLGQANPQIERVFGGGVEYAFDISVASDDRAADVIAWMDLPPALAYAAGSPDPASTTPSMIQWNFSLAATDYRRARTWLRVVTPVQTGSYTLYAKARSIDPAADDEVISGDLRVNVRSPQGQALIVRRLLQSELADPQPVLARFDAAVVDFQAGRVEPALSALLDLSDEVDDGWRANGILAGTSYTLAVELGRLSRFWQWQRISPAGADAIRAAFSGADARAATCASGGCVLRRR